MLYQNSSHDWMYYLHSKYKMYMIYSSYRWCIHYVYGIACGMCKLFNPPSSPNLCLCMLGRVKDWVQLFWGIWKSRKWKWNGNWKRKLEMETGNGNWKRKLETNQKTHQSLVQCFLHSVLSPYSSILLSNHYGTGFMILLCLYSCTVLCDYCF